MALGDVRFLVSQVSLVLRFQLVHAENVDYSKHQVSISEVLGKLGRIAAKVVLTGHSPELFFSVQ